MFIILIAIENNHTEVFELFINDNLQWTMQWNLKNKKGNTSPCIAFKYGDDRLIKKLLKIEDIDLNIIDEDNLSFLMIITVRNLYNILKLVISNNEINWNLIDNFGDSVATYAVKSNSYDCFSILIQINHINWNIQNISGNTPAIYSIISNNQEVFKILLNTNTINWNICNKENQTPLSLSIINKNDYFFLNLIQNKNVMINIEDLDKLGLLSLAANKLLSYIRSKMNKESFSAKNNIYNELLFALKTNYNKSIIQILIFKTTNDDILKFVINSKT